MTMTETLAMAAAFVGGVGLGALYWVLLWAGVRGFITGQSWRTFAAMTLLRLALLGAVAALVLMSDMGALRFAAMAAGFLVARITATRMARPDQRSS